MRAKGSETEVTRRLHSGRKLGSNVWLFVNAGFELVTGMILLICGYSSYLLSTIAVLVSTMPVETLEF